MLGSEPNTLKRSRVWETMSGARCFDLDLDRGQADCIATVCSLSKTPDQPGLHCGCMLKACYIVLSSGNYNAHFTMWNRGMLRKVLLVLEDLRSMITQAE